MKTTNIDDVYDLTPLQHGLLFHCLRSPNGGFYIEQMHFTVRGELRVDLVREAWRQIIARHPGLRTSFSWDDINRPVQIVHRTARLPLDEVDLRGLAEAEQHERFLEIMLAERRKGFDLETAPLLRLTIFRLSEDVYRFAWRFSHLILDGWSFGLLMADFVALYKGLYHGRAVQLAEPSPPSDYVGWWKRQDSATLHAYWRDRLKGHRPPPPLDLGDRPEPVTDSVRHDYVELRLGGLAEQLRGFAPQRGLTLNTLVQGAWTIVLSRCYGVPDVTVGATMSHRPGDLPGCESIVGPLIVTVPIRAVLNPDQPVDEWLATVQTSIMDAREHAGVPLPEIRGCSDAPLSSDLFETIVSYENVPIPDISFAEEKLEHLGHDVDGRPQYPMSLVVLPGDDMPLRLVYDRQRFGQDTARRMLDRLRATLSAIVAAPQSQLAELDVVPEQEREHILAALRRTARFEITQTLPEVVREHADRAPDRVAVTGETESLTYRELVERAERLATVLHARGVRHGDRVAICLERSPQLVVGMLAILMAGGTYVPLDPTNPAARLAFVLRDSEAVALLTESGLRDRFDQDLPTVLMDGELVPPAEPVQLPAGAPSDVAYLMYTSGSTGQPKGVLVPHSNVQRLVAGARQELGLHEQDVWSMFFSPAFDGSVWEMWGALLTGARLVIVSHWVSRSPETLVELLAREQVTVCTQSPSAFQQLIAAEPAAATAERPLVLRVVVLGGEKVQPAALHDWFVRHGDDTWIVNAYGPTEATVWVCYHRVVGAETTEPAAPSLIGRPLPDTSIYLFDGQLNGRHRLAPIGAPGEMHLAGPGVALGYNRQDLTAERFSVDPFAGGAPDSRMYATGDLARLTASGELEYIGRGDAQVKIRGFRVELGEVENRLREHPDVRTAVAAVCQDGAGGERLQAYVVPAAREDGAGNGADENGTNEIDATALRKFCADALPEYMVPSSVTALDRIPLKPNGKVDYDALPGAEAPSSSESYVAPRNDTERRMVEILTEMLGVPTVGIDDNLIDLGLHSLLATRLVSRIRATWRVNIALRALFETPTVAALAAAVQAGGVAAGTADRPGQDTLESEVVLDDDIAPAGTWQWVDDPQHILVTGVTGFPGAYLAAELLRTTGSTVHCLIRAKGQDEGQQRLREHLQSLQLWDDSFTGRLQAVVGDLSQPFLGLGREEFDRLADQLDQIYHFGARVNFVYPYRRLRSANVQGTKEVIRLAAAGKVSVLHHASGVGVLSDTDGSPEPPDGFAEDELAPAAPRLPNGYSETKWVAERLVSVAGQRGLPVVIHRLGRVTGHSGTGVWMASGDALGELVRASVGLGTLPAFDGGIDMVPVDYVASAIAAAGRDPRAVGRIFHLVNPKPLSFGDIRRGFALAGYPAKSAALTDWYSELVNRAAATGEDWTVAIALLSEWVQNARTGLRQPSFDSKRTTEFFGDEVRCPEVDEVVLVRYLGFLADTGFIPHAGGPKGELAWLAATTAGH